MQPFGDGTGAAGGDLGRGVCGGVTGSSLGGCRRRHAELTVAAVAARSGVHATSVYRRWGTLEALLLDVAVDRLSAASPMPDTGTLRGDLLDYACHAAHDLAQPDGLAFLRAVVSTSGAGAEAARHPGNDAAVAFLAARGGQIQAMPGPGRQPR